MASKTNTEQLNNLSNVINYIQIHIINYYLFIYFLNTAVTVWIPVRSQAEDLPVTECECSNRLYRLSLSWVRQGFLLMMMMFEKQRLKERDRQAVYLPEAESFCSQGAQDYPLFNRRQERHSNAASKDSSQIHNYLCVLTKYDITLSFYYIFFEYGDQSTFVKNNDYSVLRYITASRA